MWIATAAGMKCHLLWGAMLMLAMSLFLVSRACWDVSHAGLFVGLRHVL